MTCINPHPMEARHVAADARLFANRDLLMASLPRRDGGPRVAELGVQYGLNAAFILTLEPEVLHLLDINLSLVPADILGRAVVVAHEGDGATTLDTFAPDSLDWVYVDGHHGYESALRDGRAAMRVAPIVVFNDYTNWSIIEREEYGVITAVNQLLNEHPEWEVFAMGLQRDGYHDLAIRRRA